MNAKTRGQGSPAGGRATGRRCFDFAIAFALVACKGGAKPDNAVASASAASSASGATLSAPPSVPPSSAAVAPQEEPAPPGQSEGTYVVKNFTFASGEVLPEVRLHYTTLGSPHRDAHGAVDNAILLLHGTTGRAKALLSDAFRQDLYGAKQPFDMTKFFIVLPDNIGHGASTKPSEALHGRFPHYAYHDMVQLQHLLVTEGLGLTHLRLVAGTSMGGMHTWVWTEDFPTFMDAAIPIASTPTAIRGRNLLWRRMIVEATRSDPEFAEGEYTHPPRGYLATLPLFYMMIDSSEHLLLAAPDLKQATDLLGGWAGHGHPPIDANDAIYALDASRDYDPEPNLDRIVARVLAINFADDEIVGPSLEEGRRAMAHVPHGKMVVIPASAATRGHSTLGIPARWRVPAVEFLRSLPEPLF